MTATAKARTKKTTKKKAAPVVDKCASCPELTQTTRTKTTPPPFADYMAVIGKLQNMSEVENAKASWKQLLRMNFDAEAGHFRRDIAPIKIVQTLQETRRANGDIGYSIFHSLAWMVLADERWPAVFLEYDKDMADIRARLDAAPDDQDLIDQYDDLLDYHLSEVMKAMEEHDMADLYLNNLDEFVSRFEQGLQAIGEIVDPESVKMLDQLRQRMAASKDRCHRRGVKL